MAGLALVVDPPVTGLALPVAFGGVEAGDEPGAGAGETAEPDLVDGEPVAGGFRYPFGWMCRSGGGDQEGQGQDEGSTELAQGFA